MLVKSTIVRIGALSVLLSLILAACAAPATPPTPEPVAVTPQPTTPPTQVPAPTAEEAANRPIQITDAQVQIGVGSPIPVEVVASGTMPDLCAQVAQVEQRLSGTRIEIEILANPADPNCPPDPVGIPFRIAVPLNMVQMPLGAYTVVVNGVETSFEWTGTSPVVIPVENLGLTFAYHRHGWQPVDRRRLRRSPAPDHQRRRHTGGWRRCHQLLLPQDHLRWSIHRCPPGCRRTRNRGCAVPVWPVGLRYRDG